MDRRTKYIVYVDKAIMDKPNDLTDAVYAYLVKKGLDPLERKKFLAAVMNATTLEHTLKAIDLWVQVRDAAHFPFRKDKNKDADEGDTGGVSMDDGADGEPESGDTPD